MKSRQEALKMINGALASNDVHMAWVALGYCKCVLEAAEVKAETKLEVRVESVAPMQEEHKPTFQEYCEAETQKLKHDVIAEEEKTYYLHRAYLKDEVCKRWPNTNTMIKKILNGHGIRNIEEFYDYFTTSAHWSNPNDWGLAKSDVDKIHNMYMVLNEESGCSAEEKLVAYCGSLRLQHYLTKIGIYTKSQLRRYIHDFGNVPYTKGIDDGKVDKLNNKVKEELALHAL